MARRVPSWTTVVAVGSAVGLGLLVAWFDVAAPFGDDTAKGTLLLWAAASGLLGLVEPRKAWRWALLVGPGVPAVHFVRHALGRPDAIHPNTYATILVLVPVSLATCLIAACGGSWLRAAVGRP